MERETALCLNHFLCMRTFLVHRDLEKDMDLDEDLEKDIRKGYKL